jgi:regulator of replication initiation timing
MNKLVSNIPLFSTTLEYFDRQTGGAWRLRSCLTGMGVWSSNSHLWALQSGDPETISKSMIVLATIRTWLHEVANDGFALDLTTSNIRKTLGLDKVVDTHEEAKRLARIKCIKARHSTNFVKWYKDGFEQLDEQRKRREQSVEQITELLAGTGFETTEDVADHLQTFYAAPYNTHGYFTDVDIYDEAATEHQLDSLSECLANVLVTAREACDAEYSAAITEAKVAKLGGFLKALDMGLEIVGVDSKKLATRRAKLDELIETEASKVDDEVKSLDDQITEQMSLLSQSVQGNPHVTTVIKSDARLAREAAEIAAATEREAAERKAKAEALAEDQAAEAAAAKARKAALAKANREAKRATASTTNTVKDLSEIGSLMVS